MRIRRSSTAPEGDSSEILTVLTRSPHERFKASRHDDSVTETDTFDDADTRLTESNAKPRAGRSVRRRVLRHYLPIAALSAVVTAGFLNIDRFDANRYGPPPPDIFSEGVKGAWPTGTASISANEMSPRNHTGGGPAGSPRGKDESGDRPSAPSGGNGGGAGHTGPPPGYQHGGGGNSSAGSDGAAVGQAPATNETSAAHGGNLSSVLRMRRLATASGYLATGLLAITLLIGPVNLLRRRRTPLSTDLRRDVGIATMAMSVAHVVFGFLVRHGDGQILGYFFAAGDRSRVLTTSFGIANWLGLLAAVVVVGLAVISNDLALRKLRARRWKQLQRLTYVLFALVVAHSIFYGALWRKTSPYTWILALATALVLVGQGIGIRLWRRRTQRVAAAAAA